MTNETLKPTPKSTKLIAELMEDTKNTVLAEYCEDLDIALNYYNDNEDGQSFIAWFREEYIDHAIVVYYHNAIKFLSEHDPSLQESMEKASDLGYETSNLNSELLATLLMQDIALGELCQFEDKLDDIFIALKEEEKDDD
jgi:hypothetical protein